LIGFFLLEKRFPYENGCSIATTITEGVKTLSFDAVCAYGIMAQQIERKTADGIGV
jgi:hypothetical protein